MGIGFGTDGRAVVSNTSGPEFESSYQIIYSPFYCIETTNLSKKRPGTAQFFNKNK